MENRRRRRSGTREGCVCRVDGVADNLAGAVDGIAAPTASPHVCQLTSPEAAWSCTGYPPVVHRGGEESSIWRMVAGAADIPTELSTGVDHACLSRFGVLGSTSATGRRRGGRWSEALDMVDGR